MIIESINPEVKKDIPDTPEGRIKELMQLSLKDKRAFIPPIGQELQLGPFKFEVMSTNVGQLRFVATLVDVIIAGVNDGRSGIIDPKTGRDVI